MTNAQRLIRRLCFAALAVASATAPSPSSAIRPADLNERLAHFSDTRIRKLHLVRPDLLGYPLVHDAYC